MNHQVHEPRGHALVSSSRTAAWREELRSPGGHVGSRLHHGWDVDQESHHAGWQTVLLVLRSLEYFLQGNTEQHQLTLIAQLCGAICPEVFFLIVLYWLSFSFIISPKVWPGVEQLDLYSKMEVPKIQKRQVICRVMISLYNI